MSRMWACVAMLACGSPEVQTRSTTSAPPPVESEPQLTLPSPTEFAQQHPTFDTYWYRGKAELSRYRLSQHRYGDTHEGEAVLIFVTEPFRTDTQVKDESGAEGSVSVLKLNAYRRFYTGIYPYTIMTSSFVPATGEGLEYKISTSVSEWCGNAYAQLNRREDGVHVTLHSYFENEADQAEVIAGVPTEDGLWARLRRDPSSVPSGSRELVPGLHWLRMRHHPIRGYRADVEVSSDERGHRLEVVYPELGRTLRVRFDRDFPHAIAGWEELDNDGGRTIAERTHAIIDDYWAHHGAGDSAYREALGLEF